jgi:putative transposase
MSAVKELAPALGTAPACRAIGLPRAFWYRRSQATARPPQSAMPRKKPKRALSEPERQAVIDTLHEPRFVDRAPAEVWATLLDEDAYLCSIRTMYRILQDREELRERRNQARRTHYAKPELLATRPNQVWSWDITRLKGPVKWSYYQLYTILDIYSRYAVGWMIAYRESAVLAQRLIEHTAQKQGIQMGQLTIHADRGSSMTSRSVALLLADLGINKTHSRPHVSNDNPFSESQFKTLKYHPDFPERFGTIQEAREFCRTFFAWYNAEHRHLGLGLLTPETVHCGRAQEVIARRQDVLTLAYDAHPERFVHRSPTPTALPEAVWINPPDPERAAGRSSH